MSVDCCSWFKHCLGVTYMLHVEIRTEWFDGELSVLCWIASCAFTVTDDL